MGHIRDEKKNRRVLIRLISKGKWTEAIQQVGPKGYTVWSIARTTGRPQAKHVGTAAKAVEAALKT